LVTDDDAKSPGVRFCVDARRNYNKRDVDDLLFHRRTRASYVYNGCLAWYNVVLTPRVHSSVKFVGLLLATRATVE